jgi:hypothetical protein
MLSRRRPSAVRTPFASRSSKQGQSGVNGEQDHETGEFVAGTCLRRAAARPKGYCSGCGYFRVVHGFHRGDCTAHCDEERESSAR